MIFTANLLAITEAFTLIHKPTYSTIIPLISTVHDDTLLTHLSFVIFGVGTVYAFATEVSDVIMM